MFLVRAKKSLVGVNVLSLVLTVDVAFKGILISSKSDV